MRIHKQFFFISMLSALLFLPFLAFNQAITPLDIALRHLHEERDNLNLTEADLSDFKVTDSYLTKHNGVNHIWLRQQYQGIEVELAMLNINVLPNGQVLNVGNRFVSDLAAKVKMTQPSISATAAVKAVIAHFDVKIQDVLTIDRIENEHLVIFKKDGIALEPIKVQLMYQVQENGEVRLTWNVSLYELDAQNWRIAGVDASTGEVLNHYNQVIHCNFGTPETTCHEASHAHTHFEKTTFKENKNLLLDNAYYVLPLSIESPNHGVHELVEAPADIAASPFGWHDTNAAPGAEFTITRGNNVHAYQDIFALNASQGDEPDGGDTLVFNYPFDAGENFPYVQRDAAVVNLFYWNNIIHDLWWHYGFDEVSGNFQQNNYGNGGAGNDYVLAEALDGSGTNNANFSTPADGGNGRMQMYFWGNSNPPAPGGGANMEVLEPDAVASTYPMVPAGFGNDLPPDTDPIISHVVLVDDGTDTTSDACETILNGEDFEGKVAMIDRGNCQFGTKVLQAEQLGAIAVIVCNNVTNPPIVMGAGNDGGQVTIPSVMISIEDCDLLKMSLGDSLVVQLAASDPFTVPEPGPAGIDGDFDNGIIVHEYTHGISNRLTGGPNTGGCLNNFEQAGEGWSDWFAVVMTTTSDMTADQRRGMGTYAIEEPTNGTGIRNFPYTRNMNINPFTYANINSVSVPHGVGSVWCTMIWDLYWNLVDVHGFDEDFYHGTGGNNVAMQLVLDGLKLQPCNPNFIDARDAIIAADIADFNGEHVCLIWDTFARRGLGYSASAGGNEAFDMNPLCFPTYKIDKQAVTEADAGDIITYTLLIRNDTPEFLESSTVQDELPTNATLIAGSSSCGGIVSGDLLTISLGGMETGDQITCTYQMQIDADLYTLAEFEDGLEAGGAKWSKVALLGDTKWKPNLDNPRTGTFAWHIANEATGHDQTLELKNAVTLSGDAPAMTFWHHYATEESSDGGVIEITTDGGTTWQDLGANIIQNGYNGTLFNDAINPLAEREAWNGNSGGYIQTVVDLSNFIGQEIKVRFRFGSDGNVGAEGWYIDDIVIYDNLGVVVNKACFDTPDGLVCDEVGTIVFGEIPPSNVRDLALLQNIDLFPNPTSGSIQLKVTDATYSKATLTVTSIEGQVLETRTIETNAPIDMSLAEFGKGVYFLQVQTDEATATRRIVVQ